MKKITILLLLFTTCKWSGAQNVGIGTATPDSSAMLEIKSNDKGLLLPRVSDTSSIKKPARGLLVYNNYDNTPWYYDGNRWQKTIPDATMATEAIGMDSLWYKVQDTIAYTLHPYVQINTSLGLVPPQANLQVTGNFLVQPKLAYSNTAPTPAQTYTMNNTATLQSIPVTDSVFRVYDPGGTGNYNNNMQGNVFTSFSSVKTAGFKISSSAADFGLGTGDTLWIAYDVFPACRTKYAYVFTNTTVNPGDFVVGGAHIYFIFRSNADGVVGKGFNFSVSRLYNMEVYKKVQAAGPALYFNSSNGAFGAGSYTNANGTGSIAMGNRAIANGAYATAIGNSTMANGSFSTALGNMTTVSGDYSTAIGNSAVASGSNALAMGDNVTASGNNATAIGNNVTSGGIVSIAIGNAITANGNFSTAMGNYVSTNNYNGSFIIGDNSTVTVMNSANENNFRARFAGGYKLFTSANLSTGCTLYAGDNAWTTGSDVRSKENFAEVNGEDFLKKIAGFHLTSWNYKTQDPKIFRHYGPMAQEFHAAFGKDKYGTIGNDTSINSADFAGVSFVAIQALEKRTTIQQQQFDQTTNELKKQITDMHTIILQLRKELSELKQGTGNKNL